MNALGKTSDLVVILISIALFLSCAVQQDAQVKIKDGKEYGVVEGSFRHRWWNHYERGLSFAEGEFWKEAANDLKEAVKQRKADQRSARTYGMHFVDYFPHRELGVVYYHQGSYAQAENELETSLEMVDTGKTKHFLNLVRKKKLELSREIKLKKGLNAINIHSTDLTGKVTEKTVTVFGDFEGPAFQLKNVAMKS